MTEKTEHQDPNENPSPCSAYGDHRISISNVVRDVDEKDARARYKEEEADIGVRTTGLRCLGDGDGGRDDSDEDVFIVAWEENDPDNPYNWSTKRKNIILFISMMNITNSTMGSALPSMAIPFIASTFGVTSSAQEVLPISVYLIGYVVGPVVWGPVSEQVGRRTPTIASFVFFCIFTMACALAPSWAALLVFRWLVGVFASAPIVTVAGIFADIYDDPKTRGRSMAVFMVTTIFGPILAPIVSGFVSPTIGWRWSFWVALIYAGVSLVLLIFLPETFGPVLLARRAAALRQAASKANNIPDPEAAAMKSPIPRIAAPRDLEPPLTLRELLTVVLTRPLRMLLFEPIVSTSCLYLALVYAIFYMSFQAFPIIFSSIYALSSGATGLAFLPVGAGAALALPVFWAYDNHLTRSRARGAAWTAREEYRRLPLACIGGPLFVIALFWLGFSARPDTHFAVPMLAGVPFGAGFMLIFMALLNYLTDAYEIFAASANAAASTSRSFLATVLPLATTPMFRRLGVPGACSLLGGLSAGMCIIPFIFIWKGESIRARSRFCVALAERKAEMERKVEEQRRRRAAGEPGDAGSIRGSVAVEARIYNAKENV